MAFMFEKLEVYQKAVDFADEIAALTERFPRGYGFGTGAGGRPLHPRVSFHRAAPPSGYGISGRCSADAPSVPAPDGFAPLTDAASGKTPDGLRARRKPMLSARSVGTAE